MLNADAVVLIHNALHAGSGTVSIPGSNRILRVKTHPISLVRYVIAADESNQFYCVKAQNPGSDEPAAELASLGAAITRVFARQGDRFIDTGVGVLNGRFTRKIHRVLQVELEHRTLA